MDDDRLTSIEQAIAELRSTISQRFDQVDQRFDQVDQRFEAVDRRFDAVDRRFDETQAQMKALIDDVRDDVRIVVEGHVALERRVTALEKRKR
jgi:hypothetical protein